VSAAPRKRGRPAGSTKVHPDRDRLIHFIVEWAILKTGLGIGRGVRNPSVPDACIIAAWLLTGGAYQSEYLDGDPNRRWLVEAARIDAGSFHQQLTGIANVGELLAQLRRVDHLSVRRAYRAVQAAHPWRPSVREDVRRAERTRQALAHEPLPDIDALMDDDL
jgi:hypothetical protein